MDVGDQCRAHPTEHAHECRDQTSAASFSLDHCTGQKKALLIGISNVNSEGYPELTGAHGDVKKMCGLLLEKYHYTPSQITTLLDDGIPGHVQPTRDNILAAIAEFVKGVKEGDQLFFHYSGHSTRVPLPNPRFMSEEDGKAECLVPLDGEEGVIVNKELHAALVQSLPAGSRLVAVLDACHSGSLLDLKHYRCNRIFVPWTWRGRRNSEEIRSNVVRRGARLLTLFKTGGALQTPAHNTVTPTSPARASTKRRSIISVVCDPPASSIPSSRASTGLSHTGTASSLAKGPRLLARTRTMSADKNKDKNLTKGDVGPVLPTISKPPESSAPSSQAHNTVTPTSPARAPATRRSIITLMRNLHEFSTPSSRASTGLSRAGIASSLPEGPRPLARLRSAARATRAHTMFADRDKYKKDLTEGDSKMSWILPDEELRCESPVAVGRFLCDGWCRNIDGRATLVDGEDGVKADVIALASCKDSQIAWEADGDGMTSVGILSFSHFSLKVACVFFSPQLLVELLTENPHRSLKDVLFHISHATHSLAVMRQGRLQAYKRKHKMYAALLVRTIARLEGDTDTLPDTDNMPDTDTLPAHCTLGVRPTSPVRAEPGLMQRVGEYIVWLKQRLKEMRKTGGFDIDNFQDPQLASSRPLDMNRPWRM
ncbi:caspase domain-containing protein [Mycena capillaripes]|nr:caspase domain-containing protein [Mycena capillaripes]